MLQKKYESIELLNAQLNSKVRILDKERDLLSKQAISRRNAANQRISENLQTDTQLSTLKVELEELAAQHKKLKEECTCRFGPVTRSRKAKRSDADSGYTESLKQMETSMEAINRKKRELMLVNAQCT